MRDLAARHGASQGQASFRSALPTQVAIARHNLHGSTAGDSRCTDGDVAFLCCRGAGGVDIDSTVRLATNMIKAEVTLGLKPTCRAEPCCQIQG
jgi:hypothetical protein